MGRPDAALSLIARADTIAPKNRKFQRNRATLLERLGRRGQAAAINDAAGKLAVDIDSEFQRLGLAR